MENAPAANAEVVSRHRFYRDGFRWLLRSGTLQALTNFVLGVGVVYALTHVVPPQILAVDEHGTVKEVIPFSDPVMSEADMKKWASDAIMQTCTANWLHYREQIGAAEGNFTTAGWAGFKKEFKLEGIEQELEHEQLTMNSIPRNAPVILSSAEVGGVAHWVVQEYLLIDFYGRDRSRDRRQVVRTTIELMRVPPTVNPKGIAINNVQMSIEPESQNENNL
jgi:Type-IV b secretion system, inner-membrane complex component